MTDIERHSMVIERLKALYGDLNNLKTHNTILHTKVYHNLDEHRQIDYRDLINDELPLLECKLENGNYILATTRSLCSIYNSKKYKMNYENFEKNDRLFFLKIFN